jgi:hypothetical protein
VISLRAAATGYTLSAASPTAWEMPGESGTGGGPVGPAASAPAGGLDS